MNSSINVGLIGTGYAAQRRAEALVADTRSHLTTVWGSNPDRVQHLCQTYGGVAVDSYQAMMDDPKINLVVIATMNHLHGAIATAALKAGKHVVVEYPLALTVEEASQIIQLAQQNQRLLHVEHIELLSDIHQAVVNALPAIGQPFYARSTSLRAEQVVPAKWSYHPKQVGFPLVGALSRIQRLVNLFGEVSTVFGQSRFWSVEGDMYETPEIAIPYRSCLCSTQLRFTNGMLADVIYGKGVDIWVTERLLDIQAEGGMIHLDGNQGHLLTKDGQQKLTIGSRRGLFAKDTRMVLDALTNGAPLYVSPQQSLYALKVADAARRSAMSREAIRIHDSYGITHI